MTTQEGLTFVAQQRHFQRSDEEISTLMLKTGWQPDAINATFTQLDQLVAYVQAAKARGESHQTIATTLSEYGYHDDLIYLLTGNEVPRPPSILLSSVVYWILIVISFMVMINDVDTGLLFGMVFGFGMPISYILIGVIMHLLGYSKQRFLMVGAIMLLYIPLAGYGLCFALFAGL